MNSVNIAVEKEPLVFTTGAFLKPMRTTFEGRAIWLWTVTEFIDDSFKDGLVYNPPEFGETKENLLGGQLIE